MEKKAKKLSVSPYKGVRDFYPEDWYLQNYIFSKMKITAESFGYLEYNASILEPFELYEVKSGEEIVNEQTYTFIDKGGRKISLRPEMTPSLVRMVAAKKRDLNFPLRLYSIPNLFRYEQPQKGRMREHWQFNVDILGIKELDADIEIISVAYKLFKNLGAKDEDFEIKINDRRVMDKLYKVYGLNEDQSKKISKVIDKKRKTDKETFKSAINILLGEKSDDFIKSISSIKSLAEKLGENSPEIKNIKTLIDELYSEGIKNVIFEPSIVRGFDYYTGTVFEIFDTNPENKRSLFGGGRFDELFSIFEEENIPAIGFGAGDAPLTNFMKTHNLIPEYENPIKILICPIDEKYKNDAKKIANKIRNEGLNVTINLTNKKIGDQIKSALKQKIRYVGIVGEDEINNNKLKIKDLENKKEEVLEINEILKYINK